MTSHSTNPARCPHCSRTIPAGAALDACPHCLLAAGLATEPNAPAVSPPLSTAAELAPEFTGLEVMDLLGRGGMGAVYKVRPVALDRFVALKLPPQRSFTMIRV